MPNSHAVLHGYKNLIKALVRSERRGRILQKKADIKREMSVITYKRMQIVREQNSATNSANSPQHIRQMNELNKKAEALKQYDINKDRTLYFLADTTPFRELVTRNGDNVTDIQRELESIQDASEFVNSQREYDELMELYNLSNKYTQEERIKATANRVGLQVPDF